MSEQPNLPQWYRSLRAFLLGTTFGMLSLSGLQQLHFLPAPLPTFPLSLTLLIAQLPTLLILSIFELGFGIARYRRLRRQVDRRATFV